MELDDIRDNAFFGEDVYYDLAERNYLTLEGGPEDGVEPERGEVS